MKWTKKDIDPTLVRTIAHRYQIDTLTASIFVRRNLIEPEQIRFYLEDDLQLLYNPFLFASMEDALDRILTAREEEEKVLVFGDSDTDGITSTVLMTDALKDFGLEVLQKVPEGEEPYGLSNAAVDFAEEHGIRLIITVDCGISNHEEIAYARQKGIDVIVADHHHLQASKPPEAIAVLDPKLPDSGYPFRDLSGCGVCLKLAHALAIARLGMYKEPLALLYGGVETGAPETKPATVIEAVRLDNLIETSRLKISSGPDGALPSDTLQKLEKFLRGRIIISWNKKEIGLFFREHFNGGVDLDVMDLSQLVGAFWPSMAKSSLAELMQASRMKKYARQTPTALDTVKNIFGAYILQALQSQGLLTERMFQLAALGTIADLMPLRDENRLIVRRGIEGINRAPTGGIRELKMSLNLARPLGAIDIAWQITPTLNAAGRLGTPGLALNLLQADTVEHAMEAASQLIQANTERRRLGTEGWDIVRDKLNESLAQHGGKFAVVGSAEIKTGITGLLASRAANMMKVPVIVAVFKTDGTCTGSIRGSASFPLTKLLAHCADLFLDYGGHDSAAGFTLKTEQWQAFLIRLSEFMDHTEYSAEEPELAIDAELPHAYVTPELLELCRRFEPFGEENDPLVFCSKRVPMIDAQIVGKNGKSHLKLTLDFGAYKWPAMLWDGAERLERDFSFRNKDKVDILYKVTTNYWNGEERPQIELYDIRRTED
jgi:single-stranded-DNA-specific exonuclease